MACSGDSLRWAQGNVLWLILQPRRRLKRSASGSWTVNAPSRGAWRTPTYVDANCAKALIDNGLVEPSGSLYGGSFCITPKGIEAHRTGRLP